MICKRRVLPEVPLRLDLESFGVPYSVEVDSRRSAPSVGRFLVPGSIASSRPSGNVFSVRVARGGRRFDVIDSAKTESTSTMTRALATLSAWTRMHVATSADPWVFIHAGVVSWKGKLVVIPGQSFSGKSTLVAALLRLGADYYSDEFAVLGAGGRVHPFAKPLSIRRGGERYGALRTPESFGGVIADEPRPISLVVHTGYQRYARWRQVELGRAQMIVALLANAVATRLRPRATLDSVSRAVAVSRGISTQRGDASVAARAIIKDLEHTL